VLVLEVKVLLWITYGVSLSKSAPFTVLSDRHHRLHLTIEGLRGSKAAFVIKGYY